jgi:cytochrome c553
MTNDDKRKAFDLVVWTSSLLFAGALVAHEARAKDESFAVTDPTYRAECGSCHVAYPPALLPARSWQAVLGGLDEHFGTDASVDAKTLAGLRAFLDSNAGRDRRVGTGTAGLRISTSEWFWREHRKVPEATWKGAAVKSAANCAACHTGAESGDYSERGISVPK